MNKVDETIDALAEDSVGNESSKSFSTPKVGKRKMLHTSVNITPV